MAETSDEWIISTQRRRRYCFPWNWFFELILLCLALFIDDYGCVFIMGCRLPIFHQTARDCIHTDIPPWKTIF